MTPSIPKTQKAAVVSQTGAKVQVRDDFPVRQPHELAPGECLVRLHCTGVCHTDLHAATGDWPVPPEVPLVGGHEGVGEVVAIGKDTIESPVKIGDRVGIKWIAYSCLNCEMCRKGLEQSQSSSSALLTSFSLFDCRLREGQTQRIHHRWHLPAIRCLMGQHCDSYSQWNCKRGCCIRPLRRAFCLTLQILSIR